MEPKENPGFDSYRARQSNGTKVAEPNRAVYGSESFCGEHPSLVKPVQAEAALLAVENSAVHPGIEREDADCV